MQLTNEERKALAESRMDKAARAYEQADVLPLIKPTGEFIDQIMSKTKEFLN